MRKRLLAVSLLPLWTLAVALEPIPPIEPRLPAPGEVVVELDLHVELLDRVQRLSDKVWEVDFNPHASDVGALVKAVKFALDHQEFYSEKDPGLAISMLDLAEARLRELSAEGEPSWTTERGRVVRGYESSIDDSYQPYGLEIPGTLDLSQPVPLLVWLHGRGDKVTDLHFIQRCLAKSQALGGFVADQQEAIILHPFGRHCVGWKHAGEIDVFEAIAEVSRHYPIDPDRIALAGFSMGGAGAWHLGAHYRDRFCAVHGGAGFVETKEYNRLTPAQYPAAHVQTLWQLYDVPSYTRNLLNGPLLAYSGTEDKQKQAADLMARELQRVGHELRHVIGEGMGHEYDEESAGEIWSWLRDCWKKGRPVRQAEIAWQTPTLRYPGYQWLRFEELESHWRNAEARAEWDEASETIAVAVENVSALSIIGGAEWDLSGVRVAINGQSVEAAAPGFPVGGLSLVRREGKWQVGEPETVRKKPGLQGPIDDAFMSRFVVVPPDRAPDAPVFARWVDFELDHFEKRWKALMRGEVIRKPSDELNATDIREANLILWGDPGSNAMIAEIADRLPVRWAGGSFEFRGQTYSLDEVAPVLIFPNPLNPDRYVVINSGLTFREAHDRTNSQQNPKLPDWAMIGLDQLPDAESPGRILRAGFFNERWR